MSEEEPIESIPEFSVNSIIDSISEEDSEKGSLLLNYITTQINGDLLPDINHNILPDYLPGPALMKDSAVPFMRLRSGKIKYASPTQQPAADCRDGMLLRSGRCIRKKYEHQLLYNNKVNAYLLYQFILETNYFYGFLRNMEEYNMFLALRSNLYDYILITPNHTIDIFGFYKNFINEHPEILHYINAIAYHLPTYYLIEENPIKIWTPQEETMQQQQQLAMHQQQQLQQQQQLAIQQEITNQYQQCMAQTNNDTDKCSVYGTCLTEHANDHNAITKCQEVLNQRQFCMAQTENNTTICNQYGSCLSTEVAKGNHNAILECQSRIPRGGNNYKNNIIKKLKVKKRATKRRQHKSQKHKNRKKHKSQKQKNQRKYKSKNQRKYKSKNQRKYKSIFNKTLKRKI
jgi:hypothetical protein